MLYALLISVIFGMIMSFYLHLVVENQKNLLSQKQFLSAQLMARMTQERMSDKKTGQIRFNKGISNYQKTEKTIKITVRLENSATYQFEFPNVMKQPTNSSAPAR
jgi:hypothetical protein